MACPRTIFLRDTPERAMSSPERFLGRSDIQGRHGKGRCPEQFPVTQYIITEGCRSALLPGMSETIPTGSGFILSY